MAAASAHVGSYRSDPSPLTGRVRHGPLGAERAVAGLLDSLVGLDLQLTVLLVLLGFPLLQRISRLGLLNLRRTHKSSIRRRTLCRSAARYIWVVDGLRSMLRRAATDDLLVGGGLGLGDAGLGGRSGVLGLRFDGGHVPARCRNGWME